MKADPSLARLRFDRFELDEAEARLTCAAEPVALAPKPFAVLCALARTPGSLVTKNALLDLVWGHRFVTESVLKTAISKVRAALDDDPKRPRCIETVSRRGYRFIAATIGPSPQRAPAIARNVAAGRAPPALAALTALTALCRGDAALAELIRAVAAALGREPLVHQRVGQARQGTGAGAGPATTPPLRPARMCRGPTGFAEPKGHTASRPPRPRLINHRPPGRSMQQLSVGTGALNALSSGRF